MINTIPIEIKKKCIELKLQGCSTRQIYDTYFKKEFDKPQSYDAFRCSIGRWSKSKFPDETTLEKGTYNGYVAHGATVQVSGDGSIVQAWIKQKQTEFDPEDFMAALKENVEKYEYSDYGYSDSKDMLEIPLFDMHWGIAFLEHYESCLNSILEMIRSQHWQEINILFGQDFFHNDSVINGITTKGTFIEKVDTQRAVKDGKIFMYAIIDASIESATKVNVTYSPGNHDRSISWMFMQVLLEKYGPFIVDDEIKFRKVISYGSVAIMHTHGDSKRANANNLAHIFPTTFPLEFSKATVKEVHAGHLHTEYDIDIFGIMIRRLSTGNITDGWSDLNDFINNHKRFMIFSWTLDKLKAIYYI